jgi:hypothetical protein
MERNTLQRIDSVRDDPSSDEEAIQREAEEYLFYHVKWLRGVNQYKSRMVFGSCIGLQINESHVINCIILSKNISFRVAF